MTTPSRGHPATSDGSTLDGDAVRPYRGEDGGRSRITAAYRLVFAAWLLWRAVSTLLDPPGAAAARGVPTEAVMLPAGISFAISLFLLSGFMVRVSGLALAVVGISDLFNWGFGLAPLVIGISGLYFVVRGGGTWAMDVYVYLMQERVRRREAAEARGRASTSHELAEQSGGGQERR